MVAPSTSWPRTRQVAATKKKRTRERSVSAWTGSPRQNLGLAERNRGNQHEKQLRQRGVKNSDAGVQLGDAQAAQNSLRHHGNKGADAQHPQPAGRQARSGQTKLAAKPRQAQDRQAKGSPSCAREFQAKAEAGQNKENAAPAQNRARFAAKQPERQNQW